MKKKKIFTELFSLLFVAALVFMIYVLIEMRSSVLSVVGAGVVLLITAYLLIDFIYENIVSPQNPDPMAFIPEADPIASRLDDMQNVAKAIYTATKRNGTEAASVNQALLATLAAIDSKLEAIASSTEVDSALEINQRRILQVEQNVHDLLQFIRQDQQNGVKMIIKYNKENARQLAEIINEDADKLMNKLSEQLAAAESTERALETMNSDGNAASVMDTTELLTKLSALEAQLGILATIDSKLASLAVIEEKLASGIAVAEPEKKTSRSRKSSKKAEAVEVPAAEAAPEPPADTVLDIPILDALMANTDTVSSEPVADVPVAPIEELSIDEEIPEIPVADAPETEPEPEPIVEVAPVPEPVSEPESIVEAVPEPVADPFAGLVSDDPNKALSADDIAALFAAANAASAPAPEPEPVPEPEPIVEVAPEPVADPFAGLVSDDPNKALSADDIAALFAAANAASAPAPEPEPEPVHEPEPAPEPEPEPAADPLAGLLSDDPNKKMSPDDIAALFAAMGK